MHAPTFTHPEPPREKTRILPVFLPYAGCPHRCSFCAQHLQTGEPHRALADIFRRLESELEALAPPLLGSPPLEIAFYGGTFTALPGGWPERFLTLAARHKARGAIGRVRCSTRPDAVGARGTAGAGNTATGSEARNATDAAILDRLRGLGLDMVELGVQSFDDGALRASGRGYDGRAARAACDAVRAAGLELGVQLLPGLPGDRPGLFREDARITAAIAPNAARLYPCVVVEGTPLAADWRSGEYTPWDDDRAVEELGSALPVLWAAGVRVIRMGLAAEEKLDAAVLAGTRHPALGQAARARALLAVVAERVEWLGRTPKFLAAPRRYAGEIFGQRNELAPRYAALGLPRGAILFHDGPDFRLE